MTIYDISEKAGVSIATVSRVLNGSNNVSEKTRQKVLAVMEKYDYTPNAFARGLGLSTRNSIGILCANTSDPYLAKVVSYMEQQLRTRQYDSLLYSTGYDLENRQKTLHLLLSKKVDGIILVGSDFVYETPEENHYIREAAKEVPIMLFHAALDCPNVYSIVSDDFHSVFEATVSMLSSGFKDILFFSGSNTYSNRQKLSGYETAIAENNNSISSSGTHFYNGAKDDIASMVQSLKNLSQSGAKFNGVIASDDMLAIAALKYAKAENLKVPQQFSVIGCNNSVFATCCEPELSSIDNKQKLLCEELIRTLMEVLAGNPQPAKSIFSGELIKRETTRF